MYTFFYIVLFIIIVYGIFAIYKGLDIGAIKIIVFLFLLSIILWFTPTHIQINDIRLECLIENSAIHENIPIENANEKEILLSYIENISILNGDASYNLYSDNIHIVLSGQEIKHIFQTVNPVHIYISKNHDVQRIYIGSKKFHFKASNELLKYIGY